jgi:MBOAT, membrane-bound O-acyltransferase family/AhpC/TSA family/Copper type II ascorbate-dependent monooxygenase, C-terminal domain
VNAIPGSDADVEEAKAWDGVPGRREWVFLAVSLAGLLWSLPPYSWPLYALTLAAVYATGVSGLRRRYRVLVVLALVVGFLALERILPRPTVPFVLFFGRAIRAFFVLRAIDFVLSRPRRELSARPAHRVFQFLLFVSFLPCLFAGPVVMFNDFYRAYLPGSFANRSALLRNGLNILWGALKFYALGPVAQRTVDSLHSWANEGGGPPGIGPRALMWGFLLLQLVAAFVRYSGFTDMAIGVSRLLGFQLYENFQYPLLATNPLQFWKTWNVSAYRWLMTHVFYPSWGHAQVLLKIQTTFVASGLWHLGVSPRWSFDAAAQLFGSGILYAFGVWVVAAAGRRAGEAPGDRLRAMGIARRVAATIATFVFISFVHLVFRAGLSGRPLHSTWSDLVLLVGPAPAAEPEAARLERDRVNEMIPNVEVEDVEGRAARLGDLIGKAGLVIVVRDVDCPVSKRYGPRLAKLEATYAPQGLPFAFLNPTRHNTREQMLGEIRTFGFQGRYLRDPRGRLAQALAARSTAEVFVLDTKRTLVYRGAVDDQYGIDYTRTEVGHPFLATALDEVLAGSRVQTPMTRAPGCELGLAPAPWSSAERVTWHKQVSRIVQARCLGCHRDGGTGPFALDSYEAVAGRAATIRRVIRDGFMPPWFAAPGSGPWANDLSLSVWERRTLLRWLDTEMAPGDPDDSPRSPRFEKGWTIGTPDLVLELPEAQQVPAEGFLPYRFAAIDVHFPEDRWVQAVEVLPGARVNVHHVLVFLEQRGKGPIEVLRDRLVALGARPGSVRALESNFVGYGPGASGRVFPHGTAKRLPANTRLLFQIHYVTTGVPAVDRTQLGIVFAKEPPRHELHTASAFNRDFVIPAGAPNHEVSASYEFQDHGQLLSFTPHMHMRGKAIRYELVSPEGVRTLLLDVPRYHFNWQLAYELARPVRVAPGTRLVATGWFDNSALNLANPDPARAVTFGIQSTDEMMIGYFDWIPDSEVRSAHATP